MRVRMCVAAAAGCVAISMLPKAPPPAATWGAVLLCALVNIEALPAPIDYTPFGRIPSIYELRRSRRLRPASCS